MGLAAGGLLMMTGAPATRAESLWLPSIFSEGMVLQRDVAVPVWGRAAPGAAVTVTVFGGGQKLAEATATAAAETGRWRVDLTPLAAGGRYSLLVVSKGPEAGPEEMRLFSNVLAGEVWLVCGQSNMLHPMNACAERDDAIAHRLEYPLIRVALLGKRDSHTVTEPPADTLGFWGPAKWEEASWTVTRDSSRDVPGASSGVSYFFARALSRWLGEGVPVGMIELGQILPVESWVDDTVAATMPELAHLRGKGYPSATGRAFLANIVPLAPYAVRGAIYYQGEMNAGRPYDYYHGLRGLITSWRQAWGRPELPFLVVQLPGFIEHLSGKTALDMDADALARFDGKNPDHSYCYIREAQFRVSREVPGVGLAVIVDKGEKFDIHPPRKQPVGERLALQARTLVYGDAEVVADGPLPREFRRDGARFIVRFAGVGGGLRAEGELQGFEIQDAAGAWHAAAASIAGDTVLVQAPGVAEPAGVRYAWAGFPPVTLFNAEGLPATPFCHPAVDLAARQGK
jgi:sialate O-acetylesterase